MRSLLIGMVVFDFMLHIYQLIAQDYLINFPGGAVVYDTFWALYWGIFLICLIIEFRKKRR
jgi:hypothetical protein